MTPSLRSMLVIELVLAALLLSVLIAPMTLSKGSVPELEGHIGSVENWEELQELPWPQRAVYLIGDVNCHQQADRSYELNENQLPICARDVGLLFGMVLGLAFFMRTRRALPWLWLALLLVPMALDGGLQAVTSYESNNLIRTVTGALAGIAIGYGAGILIDRFFRSTDDSRRPVEGAGQQ